MGLLDDLAYTSAIGLARLIRDRDVSPVEVVDAAIDRIEARDPSLNAVVYKGYDDAREQAEAATRAVMAGAPLGPLHGVPTLMKDLFDFKPGWTSTFGGVKALATTVIDARCVFAERVERAGAIIVGKTNSPVMGFRGTCDNFLFGPTRNPFDTAKNTGGSSGGSAAAVADGFVPFAEGTDAGGSIRIPAAWCGLYGLKPSWGRVPVVIRPNAFGGTDPFVAEGPITRTVADAALVLQSLSGYDARDPYSLPDVPDFLAALDGDLQGVRIAYSPDFGVYPIDPRVATVVATAVRAFEVGRGHRGRGPHPDPVRPACAERPVVPTDHATQYRDVRGVQGVRAGPAPGSPRFVPARIPALDRCRVSGERDRPSPRPDHAHEHLRRHR